MLRRDWEGERYYEVLDHTKIDSRDISDGAPLLFGHNDMFHIGTVEAVTFSGGRGNAVVRFGRSALAEEKFQDVKDKILKKTSVGYDMIRAEGEKAGERDGIPIIRFRNWKPMEITLCPLPADNSVGVGREADEERTTVKLKDIMKRTLLLEAQPVGGGGAPAILVKEDFSREMDEAREIFQLATQYQRTHPEVVEAANKALKDKTPIREFQRGLMEIIAKPGTAGNDATIVARANPNQGDRSIGGQFVRSAQYKEASKRRIGKGNHINLDLPDMYAFRTYWPDMQTRVNFGIGTSDVSSTADLGGTSGAGIDIIRQPWNPLNQQPLNIADLFSQGTTAGDVVRFIQELSYTQAAARVAEAAGKPQAQLDVGVKNVTVEKTAAYLDVTEEMMNDWQQAASFINARLAYMVQSKEEGYLLNGTGSSEITGIYNTSGIQTLSGAANTIDQFLRAKAYVEGANGSGFAMPDAYVMNPLDWLSVRLTKDSNGQYLFGGPGYSPYGVGGYSNVGSMWGLPVVTTVLNAQGTALVGAFKMGAQIFRRQGVTIRTTDSDGSKFLSNILTVLAESRFALAVYQPARFCSITAIPAAS